MKKKVNIYRYFNIVQYLLTLIYVCVFLRFIILSFDNNYLQIGSTLGKISYYIKFIIITISEPFIFSFNTIANLLVENIDLNLLEILGPIGVIIILLFIKIFLKLLAPYIDYHVNKHI